jgi:hypothetical protein
MHDIRRSSNPSFSAKPESPAASGAFRFIEAPKKACFLKEMNIKQKRPAGSFRLCKVLPNGITEGNPYYHVLTLIPISDSRWKKWLINRNQL